jgi:acyl-CoA dehydrogenase
MTDTAASVAASEADGELKLLAQTCAALFGDHGDELAGPWDERLWRALGEAGLPLISVPEGAGGSGGSLEQAAVVLSSAGEHAASVPLAETSLLGGWLLAEAGLPIPAGPLVAVLATGTQGAGGPGAIRVEQVPGGWSVRGRLPRVGWGRVAQRVVVLAAAGGGADGRQGAHDVAIALRPGDVAVEPGSNVAGEPRDDLIVDTVVDGAAVAAVAPGSGEALRYRAALARVLLIAGALRRALDLTIRYAGERQQFGRSLGKFQAVQHQITELAGETAAVRAAADAALRRCADDGFTDPRARFAVASAKVQAARASTAAARIAHQVHGAIGFTDEHALRLATTRLWAWRDEAGSPADWAAELGRHVLAGRGDGLWNALTED